MVLTWDDDGLNEWFLPASMLLRRKRSENGRGWYLGLLATPAVFWTSTMIYWNNLFGTLYQSHAHQFISKFQQVIISIHQSMIPVRSERVLVSASSRIPQYCIEPSLLRAMLNNNCEPSWCKRGLGLSTWKVYRLVGNSNGCWEVGAALTSADQDLMEENKTVCSYHSCWRISQGKLIWQKWHWRIEVPQWYIWVRNIWRFKPREEVVSKRLGSLEKCNVFCPSVSLGEAKNSPGLTSVDEVSLLAFCHWISIISRALPAPCWPVFVSLVCQLVFYFPGLSIKVDQMKRRVVDSNNVLENFIRMRCRDVYEFLVSGLVTSVV